MQVPVQAKPGTNPVHSRGCEQSVDEEHVCEFKDVQVISVQVPEQAVLASKPRQDCSPIMQSPSDEQESPEHNRLSGTMGGSVENNRALGAPLGALEKSSRPFLRGVGMSEGKLDGNAEGGWLLLVGRALGPTEGTSLKSVGSTLADGDSLRTDEGEKLGPTDGASLKPLGPEDGVVSSADGACELSVGTSVGVLVGGSVGPSEEAWKLAVGEGVVGSTDGARELSVVVLVGGSVVPTEGACELSVGA